MKIEDFFLPENLNVFGMQVKTFPLGVGDAFHRLVNMIPGGFDRPYYGIAFMSADGEIVYNAAALEKQDREAEKYGCERFTVQQGAYLSVTIADWRSKTNCIKDVFHEIMQDTRADKSKPCVEWYESDIVMRCMVKRKAINT